MPPPFGLLSNDPAALGNVGLAAGLLQGGAPQATPSYFGPALGRGLMMGSQLMLEGARSNAVTAFTEAETKNRLLQAQSQQMGLDQARRSQAALEAYAATLGPGQREQFMAAPQAFLGALAKAYEPYSLNPGDVRQVAGQNVGYNPPLPTMQEVPVPGQPGVFTKQWLRPGQDIGTQVGGPGAVKAPEILNPQVLAAEIAKANAGAQRTQVLVNAYTPASEEIQKQLSQELRQNYNRLRDAPAQIQNIQQAKALIPSASVFMGPGGQGLLEAAKFFNNRLGMDIKTEGVKSAEELRTRLFTQIMDNLKKLDAQPSQLQQQVMMESLGNLSTDPQAMSKILDAIEQGIRGRVDLHNRDAQTSVQKGLVMQYDPVIRLPEPGAQPERRRTLNGKTYIKRGIDWFEE